MKLKLPFGPKTGKVAIPSSTTGVKPAAGDTPARQISRQSLGSKEEQFFDSQPWLESDCDDDFFSVNADSSPSRGDTPVHHKSSIGTLERGEGTLEESIPGSVPEPSSTDKKKRLFELFLEHMEEDLISDHQVTIRDKNKNMTTGKMKVVPTLVELPPKSPYMASYISGTNSLCSSERTPEVDSVNMERKSIGSTRCCFPRFISCRSFNERKKRMNLTLM